jgi:hypothetical protein
MEHYEDLARNGPETLSLLCATLSTLFHNILTHPNEPKYRRVRRSNASISFVLSRPGGEAFLTYAGFGPTVEKSVEYIIMPPSSSLDALRDAFSELTQIQLRNEDHMKAAKKEEDERARQAILRIKNMMKRELFSQMASPKTSSSVNPARVDLIQGNASQDNAKTKERKILKQFLGHSSQLSDYNAELEHTALLLISDIAVTMEAELRLSAEEGLVASWNVEKQRLFEKYKKDHDIAYLHKLKEEWEEKLRATKRTKGLISAPP